MQAAVTRYRVMAYLTGTLLILLFFVAVPVQLFAHNDILSRVIGMPHGMICYPLYLLTTFDLYRRVRWPLSKVVLIVLAGVIPFLTFWVERRIVAELRDSESPATAGV